MSCWGEGSGRIVLVFSKFYVLDFKFIRSLGFWV